LLAQLASDFDVLIVDSPPLGAGFDAFALGTATGNLAVVLRTGVSDCKMAAAKLKVAQTMPIRIIGAVLNCVKLTGSYEYYSYYEGYHAQDEEVQALPAPASKPGTAPVRVRNS
jgi:tyrosine-protein kinase Etk/Wzc